MTNKLEKQIYYQPVKLEEMLRARDLRLARQKRLLSETGLPLLSMTLNIPGNVKRTRLSVLFFNNEVKRLKDVLKGLGAKIEHENILREKTGDEALFAIKGLSAHAVKRLAIALEDQSPASRLLDLDVIDQDGSQISRSALGDSPRRCLLCDQPASICARSRAHDTNALDRETKRRMMQAVAGEASARMAANASEASSFELMVSKKPGLVTMQSSGSHDDMDRFTFGRAQSVFYSYYEAAFRIGFFSEEYVSLESFEVYECRGNRASNRVKSDEHPAAIKTMPALSQNDAQKLRLEGIFAEQRMFDSTDGVNTHRGWIYMSGVLLAAMGLFFRGALGEDATLFEKSDTLKDRFQFLIIKVAEALEHVVNNSPFFEQVRAVLPVASEASGVRQEALKGFPSIMDTGLPVMTSVYCSIGSNSTEYDDAMGRRVFLALLGVIDDTTVTKRGGSLRSNTLRTFLLNYWVPDVRLQDDEWITAWIEALIKADDSSIDACLSLLELQFEEERLTAGGTADALAGTRLVNSFFRDITNMLLFC